MITITKGTMEYLAAANISAAHGFTTRRGGVSEGCFRSLNLTHHRGDSRENVEENLRRPARPTRTSSGWSRKLTAGVPTTGNTPSATVW